MSSNSQRRGRKPYARPPPVDESGDGQWVHDMAPGADEGRKPRPSNPSTGNEPTRLLVSNLHYEVTQKDLSSIFGTIGTLLREPTIRYDRSGRSTGVATVLFTNARDAKVAQRQLDGVLAKGEAMSIKIDSAPSAGPRAGGGRVSSNTLLNRMGKKPLADRLAEGETSKSAGASSGGKVGPVRNAREKGKQAPAKGPKAPKAKTAPKTAEDLDKELEAFMGEGDSKEAPKDKGEDVAMV
ncbi:RNA-binding domain-containing protein [Ceratobasidium sp. AG-I]|nr:RNA-binding domain-containing protein [Ceratobasidium sp. AG-I]